MFNKNSSNLLKIDLKTPFYCAHRNKIHLQYAFSNLFDNIRLNEKFNIKGVKFQLYIKKDNILEIPITNE